MSSAPRVFRRCFRPGLFVCRRYRRGTYEPSGPFICQCQSAKGQPTQACHTGYHAVDGEWCECARLEIADEKPYGEIGRYEGRQTADQHLAMYPGAQWAKKIWDLQQPRGQDDGRKRTPERRAVKSRPNPQARWVHTSRRPRLPSYARSSTTPQGRSVQRTGPGPKTGSPISKLPGTVTKPACGRWTKLAGTALTVRSIRLCMPCVLTNPTRPRRARI